MNKQEFKKQQKWVSLNKQQFKVNKFLKNTDPVYAYFAATLHNKSFGRTVSDYELEQSVAWAPIHDSIYKKESYDKLLKTAEKEKLSEEGFTADAFIKWGHKKIRAEQHKQSLEFQESNKRIDESAADYEKDMSETLHKMIAASAEEKKLRESLYSINQSLIVADYHFDMIAKNYEILDSYSKNLRDFNNLLQGSCDKKTENEMISKYVEIYKVALNNEELKIYFNSIKDYWDYETFERTGIVSNFICSASRAIWRDMQYSSVKRRTNEFVGAAMAAEKRHPRLAGMYQKCRDAVKLDARRRIK